jgi:hypothetical protein
MFTIPMKQKVAVTLPRHIVIASFLLLATVWIFLFISDAGNFWHGGSVGGLIATDVVATLGTLMFADVVRSNASKLVKAVLAIVAAPLALYTTFGLFYAAKHLVAA